MRIAVVGSGVAGLGAAQLLSRAHDVELFERDTRPGARQHRAAPRARARYRLHRPQRPNYPYLGRLFRELGIGVQEGCLIPSLASLSGARAAASRLTFTGIEEIGIDYAETLRRWRAKFLARLDDVRALGYDEHFLRTWDFHLACCEAGFRTRALRNAQIVLER